jgi:hypothetical protein
MKKELFRKGLVIGIIILLMLVSIPMASGENIIYPEEEGPYDIRIVGPCTGMGGDPFTFYIHFWPFWFLPHILDIEWHFEQGTIFIVNGEVQDILYPADISLWGFQGYGQSVLMFNLKHIFELGLGLIILTLGITSFIPYQRARIFGRCDSLSVWVYDS